MTFPSSISQSSLNPFFNRIRSALHAAADHSLEFGNNVHSLNHRFVLAALSFGQRPVVGFVRQQVDLLAERTKLLATPPPVLSIHRSNDSSADLESFAPKAEKYLRVSSSTYPKRIPAATERRRTLLTEEREIRPPTRRPQNSCPPPAALPPPVPTGKNPKGLSRPKAKRARPPMPAVTASPPRSLPASPSLSASPTKAPRNTFNSTRRSSPSIFLPPPLSYSLSKKWPSRAGVSVAPGSCHGDRPPRQPDGPYDGRA